MEPVISGVTSFAEARSHKQNGNKLNAVIHGASIYCQSSQITPLGAAYLLSGGRPANSLQLAGHVKNNRRTVNNHDVTVGKFQLAVPVAIGNRVAIVLLYTHNDLHVVKVRTAVQGTTKVTVAWSGN